MARPPLRASLAVALAASLAACGGPAAVAPRAELPAPAAPAPATTPAPPEWQTYVPERCRDGEENPAPDCRPRRIVVTSTDIEILEPVAFVDNTAELTPGSYRTIAAVARSLIANPSILLLEVRGHSDSLLHPADRADLARKRAEVAAAYLVSQSVDPARVTTYGASDSELLYPADDPRNRRVEFVIVARDE
jgi:outer membrane protein OmpA-like peptidoglycan-associated protein